MNIKDAVKILKQHNDWRRGNTDNDEMAVTAKTIGVAIDTLTEHFESNIVLDNVIETETDLKKVIILLERTHKAIIKNKNWK